MNTALSLARFHDLTGPRGLPGSVCVRLSVASEVKSSTRRASFVFSDNSVDSYGDTIDAKGWDLTAFKANPVALYGHDPSSASNVVGRAENVRVSGKQLLGDIIFAEASVNPLAETVYQLLCGGFLNAVSVGFRPIEWKLATDKKRPGGIDFSKQQLLEVSVVAIPSNSNALMQAKAAGIDVARLAPSPAIRNEEIDMRPSHQHRAATANPAALARARRQEAERGLYPFRTLGEQLQAVANFELAAFRDDRLVRAPAGANEGAATAGGFLVQVNFADNVLGMAYDDAVIAPLCTRPEYLAVYGTMAGGVKMPGIDETSRADGSRYGGVIAYWASEAASVAASLPRFKSIEFTDRKLIGVCYVTNEMLADAALLDFFIHRAFAAEFGFKLDLAVLRGTAGTPIGVLNSSALITVDKETGQAAATIINENVEKMWGRLPIPSRLRANWLVHEDVESLLPALNAAKPSTYVPAGAGGFPYPRLMGAPVIAVEQASVLGSVGDIVLADLSHYILLDGGISPALSVHFSFDNDQAVFRFVLHIDGKPEFSSPVTPYSGTTTRSPFVALGAR